MLRRFGAAYLWFSPLTFVVLFGLYHGVSLWAGIAGGAVHFALVVLGVHACGAFKRGEESGLMLGPALLVIGGAVVWATGPSGPPAPSNLTVTAYNNAGLTLGFFITLLGFAAVVPALPSTRDRTVGSLGLVCFMLMFIIWLLQSALGFVLYSSPLINMTAAQRPEWFQILRDHQHVPMPDLESGTRYQPTGRFCAHDGGEIVFSGKRRNHFSSAYRVFVYEDDDAAVPFLRAESFRYQYHGCVATDSY